MAPSALERDANGEQLPLQMALDSNSAAAVKRERTSSDSSSQHDNSNVQHADDERTSSVQHAPPRMKKRRRHEVLRLRQVAEELERELSVLQRRQELLELATCTATNSDVRVQTHRTAAKRAIQAATRAQLENNKLRASVAAHAALAASLQQTLAKQHDAVHDIDVCVPDACVPDADAAAAAAAAAAAIVSGAVVYTSAAALSATERAIYERLLRNTTARSADLDAYVAARCVTSLQLSSALLYAETAEATVLLDDRECVCIDFVDQYVLPFDFHAGAHVLWTGVFARTLQFASRAVAQTEIISYTDDTVVSKQSGRSNYLTEREQDTTEYTISKRIAKADSVRFLWEALTESRESRSTDDACAIAALGIATDDTDALPGLQIMQEGWGSIAPMATSSRSTTTASVLQSYIRLTPSMVSNRVVGSGRDSDGCLSPPLDMVQLSSQIIRAFRRHAATIRCYIESTLLDDMARSSSASTAGA